MNLHHYAALLNRRRWSRAAIAATVPIVLAAGLILGGHDPLSRPASAAATMWLVSARGALVRANGLVHPPAEQIVQTTAYQPAHAGVRLLAQAPGEVFTGPLGGSGSPVFRVDVRTGTAGRLPGDGTVAAAGADVFRIGADTVARLGPDGESPVGGHRLGPITGWAGDRDGLYVATSGGGLHRVSGDDVSAIELDAAGSLRLADSDEGVAAYEADSGQVRLVRGQSAKVVARLAAAGTTFGAAPDGGAFAIISGSTVNVVAHGQNYQRDLGFRPDATQPPVLAEGRVYLTDQASGTVRVLGIADGLPEITRLDLHDAGHAVVDVHRNGRFLWFDDVRGPYAYALDGTVAQQIVKYETKPAPPTSPPTTTPPTTTPPPTSPPPTTATPPHTTAPTSHTSPPESTTSPTRTGSKSPSPSAHTSTSKSAGPSPSPSADPRKKCGGDDADIFMDDTTGTGPDPHVEVRVCVAASDGDRYWIVSESQGEWYAKTPIDGGTGRSGYDLHLLHGSGGTGQSRRFYVVAARTSTARDWLRENLDADKAGDEFPRGSLADDIDKISAPLDTTS